VDNDVSEEHTAFIFRAEATITLIVATLRSVSMWQLLSWKFTFYDRVLNCIAYVALVCKTADEIRKKFSF
jgi:hypothetical protein